MTSNPKQELIDFKPEKEFFVGIDSDGCAFDTMEIKHKECFCPNTIKYWNLQIISKYVRDAWDFVNLYSKTRGCNRFLALIRVIELLGERKEVKDRNAVMPDLSPLIKWTKVENKLGEPALLKYIETNKNDIIENAYKWSRGINDCIAEMVHGIPPFPFMRESLEKLADKSDLMVVSSTPVEALKREWEENDIAKYMKIIAGQEYGKKSEHLGFGAKGKYDDNKILMVGDAPGDMKAAKSNGVLFYPINPGYEELSWERFYNEALDKFFNGSFAGNYEDSLTKEFENYLPENPPW